MVPIIFSILSIFTPHLGMTTSAHALSIREDIRYSLRERTVAQPAVSVPHAPLPVVVNRPPTPTQSPAPVTTTDDFQSQVEQLVFQDTNSARAQNGLPPFTSDAQLATVARSHSVDMLQNHYFEHTDLHGCTPGCRLTQAGYSWVAYGENIHWMTGYNLNASGTAQKIVDDWMNSPPHRANMLGNYTSAGVGIAVSGSTIYSTTDFATQ